MVVAGFATRRGFHVDFDSVGVLDVLHQTPCGVEAGFARRTDVVAGFWKEDKIR